MCAAAQLPSPSPNPTLETLSPDAVIADAYRLRQRVSTGSAGQVWEAEQIRLGGRVAIKFLASCHLEDDSARARFDREARAICEVRSPYVVQVQDHGVYAGIPYLVMELLEGEDLSALLERERRLPLQETSQIIGQLCRALDKAHRAGFVHRDVKPDNVFVIQEADGSRFIKLLDFGLVKRLGSESLMLSQDGAVVGTPHYLSPEQISEPSRVDARADIWAVGVTAYRMLVGRLPFVADKQGDPSGLFSAILEGRYQPATQARAELPPQIDDWFAHMLAVSPDERFDTLQAAAAALSNVCEAQAAGRSRVTTLQLPKTTERARSARILWVAACTALAAAALVYLFSRGRPGSMASQADGPAQAGAIAPTQTAQQAGSPTQTTLDTAQVAAASLPLQAAELTDTPPQPSAAPARPSPAQPSATAPLSAAGSAQPLASRNPAPEAKRRPAPKLARPASPPPARKPEAATRQAPSQPAARAPHAPVAPLPKDRGF